MGILGENMDEFFILLLFSRGAESRQKILNSIILRPKNCNQIAGELNMDWWTVQKHLVILENNKIIHNNKMGKIKFFSINAIYKHSVTEVLDKRL
jgi:predicted transcriptional regulator